MDITELNVSAYCRTCLQVLNDGSSDVSKHNIFLNGNLAKKLIQCTSLSVKKDDEFPKYICGCCFDKINEFHKFQQICKESMMRFKDILQSTTTYELCYTYLDLDDEKPVFDLKSQEQAEIIITEGQVLTQDEYWTKQKDEQALLNKRKLRSKSKKLTAIKPLLCRQKTYKHVTLENAIETNDDKLLNNYNNQRNPSDDNCNNDNQRDDEKSAPVNRSEVFQCDVCSTRFFVGHRFAAHMREHKGLVPYPCPRQGCDKTYTSWHYLSEHLKQHDGTGQCYTCGEDGCGKVYKHKPTLAMHLRKFHKVGPEIKTHICEICGKVFKTWGALADHRYTHKDKSELPFACDQCHRRFITKEKLKVHLMRHAGIKNFVCSYCGMRKTTRNELRTHLNYHTLERRWPCRLCAQIFNSAGNLRAHVRTVHEHAKDFACRFCDRTFAKSDTKKYHEMTHTGEKPNECNECGKRFTQPAALRTHKKMHLRHRMQMIKETQVPST